MSITHADNVNNAVKQIAHNRKNPPKLLGAVHMSRAGPANRADSFAFYGGLNTQGN